jgi:hypothetical protein
MSLTIVHIQHTPSIPDNRAKSKPHRRLMSTHASVLVNSVGPPSAEVRRTAASFP